MGAVEVGIRELRADLSRLMKRVAAGEELVVTDRGKAFARVVPLNGKRTFESLVREGRITPAPNRGKRTVPDLTPLEGIDSLSEFASEGRG